MGDLGRKLRINARLSGAIICNTDERHDGTVGEPG